MALADTQRKGFEDRLSRIKKGGANTMGEVQIGPRDESQRGKSKPANTVRLKKKKAKNVNIGEGSNLVFGIVAAFIGVLCMIVGQAAEYHLFHPDGVFNVTIPVEAIQPAIPYAHFIVAVALALALGWAFGLTNMIRRMAMLAGMAAAVVWQADLVERYAVVYTAIFSETLVAAKLGCRTPSTPTRIRTRGPAVPAGPLVVLERKKMLKINNLHVKLEDEDKQILKGVDLDVPAGTVHAIMGPNGSGKSTLSYVLSGRDGYEVTEGTATLEGQDILELEAEERAAAGLFLAFQYPVEIPGVGNMTFMRTALNAQRKARGEDEISAADFLKLIRAKAKELKIDADMLKRPVNVGFSGGEKKRNEILQMALLEPRMCILDETDSGLDVDAMKLVADGVNALRDAGRAFLVITHYQRLLDHIAPDVVHIMADGRIVKSGGPELAIEVETNGYADILAEVA